MQYRTILRGIMRHSSVITIAGIVALIMGSAVVRVQAGDVLTMDEAVATALTANPELAAAAFEAEAGAARPPQAASPPDPEFMVDFIGVPTDTADVSRGTVQYMVEQDIPFPGKLIYGYKAEQRAAEALGARHDARVREIARQVKGAYIDCWRLQEEDRIARETLSLYSTNKHSAEEAYAALEGEVADPVRASVELGEVEGMRALIVQDRLDAEAELARLMNAPLEDGVALVAPPLPPRVAKLEDLVARARGVRPELKDAERTVAAGEARLSLAKSQYGPDLTLRGGFMDNPSGLPNAWYGRVGVTVPLWSFSKQNYGVRESKALLKQSQAQRSATELTVEADVKKAYARIVAARKAADIYAGTVTPRARILLNSSLESYRAKKGSFLGVVDSIRSLTNAQVMAVRARADAAKAYADLERAVGASPSE